MTKKALKQEAEEYALNQWEGNIPWSVIQKSYYDGALPREKRIAELEATNKKISDKCHKLVDTLEEKQEEIAELKVNFKIVKDNEYIYQSLLIKAKEIIKTLLGFAEAFGYSPSMDKFITEAEQFLKED